MARIALLIGVSEYEPGLNPLPGSALDVDAMHRVLSHPEMGGFAPTDITVLKNPDRQAMENAIYQLFENRKKEDLLLLYFSGHGIRDDFGKLYLATKITRKENGKLFQPSAVAATVLHECINNSRSQHQVIILDCCFSGAIAQGMTVKDAGTIDLQKQLGGKGRAILTSSTATEYSFGSDFGSDFSSEGAEHQSTGLSVYTRYLVEGIETGAADGDDDGWIGVDELHDYAHRRVKEVAPAMTPKFYPVEEGFKILLAKSPQNDPVLKYRKEVQKRAEQGHGRLSIPAKSLLREIQSELKLSPEIARDIEDEVLQPYREYARKLQAYEQTLQDAVQQEYPFNSATEIDLKDYQKYLKLRDSDIADIAVRVLEPARRTYEQRQEAERLRLRQQQEEAERLRLQQQQQEAERLRLRQQQEAERLRQQQQQEAERQQRLQQQQEAERRQKALRQRRKALRQRLQQQQEAERRQEALRQREVERQRSEANDQPVPIATRPGTSTTAPMTRQKFLKLAGFGGGGLVAALIIGNQHFQNSQTPSSPPSRSFPPKPLKTDASASLTKLEGLLKAGNWKAADQETLAVMLKIAKREEEGWLDVDSIKNFPCGDLQQIDQLWVKYSNGKFGFSVQKKIHLDVGGTPDGEYRDTIWRKFGDRVGWRVKNEWISYSDVNFSTSAPMGHLPIGWFFGWRRDRFWWQWQGGVVSSLASMLVNCSQ